MKDVEAPSLVDARTLKRWLGDGGEIALLDVREEGEHTAGHPFLAVPAPYSSFEARLPALVPDPDIRLVLMDGGDGRAARTAAIAREIGYSAAHVLDGGAPGWAGAGFTLFEGINVPSKAFGEIVEHKRGTPRVTADELAAMQASGADMLLVDGRTVAEHGRFTIPGGIACPNGELPLRIAGLAPDPGTAIVVHCAGRTRSIIGAQTLIDLGIRNPVFALENGTQGWLLAGRALLHGDGHRHPDEPGGDPEDARRRALALARAHGAGFIDPATLSSWLGARGRATYLFDVRSEAEFARDGVPGSVHAPGGQLVQATDRWVGVRHARIILLDGEGVRAPVTAAWLRQLGHDAYVLEGGIAALHGVQLPLPKPKVQAAIPAPAPIAPAELVERLARESVCLVDLRSSADFRESHIAGAEWSIRPKLGAFAGETRPIVLVADDPAVAGLAARDLAGMGLADIRLLAGHRADWESAGLSLVATPDEPADSARIDHMFHTERRNLGDLDHARAYLAWEIGLVDRLDAEERAVFRVG